MSVRAKFVVNSITRTKGWGTTGEIQTINLSPVTDGSEEDKRFWAATPSGNVQLGIVNKDAGDYFKLGEKYYLDFTEAEQKEKPNE